MELMALIFAGWAAYAFSGPPPRTMGPVRTGRQLPGWLRPRPDALPSRLRWGAGAIAGMMAYLFIADWGTLAGLAIGLLVAGGIGWGLGRLEPPAAQRAREQRIADLPHALELLAGCLACGLPLRRAVREVAGAMDGPIADDLALVVGLVDVGVDEREAWLRLAERPGWAGIARDIGRAAEAGSGLGNVLDRYAEWARRAAHSHRQQRARTLGVRSVLPLMICFLPAFVLIGIVPAVGSIIARIFE